MVDWFTWSIISLLFYGIYGFLFKVAAEKRCNSGSLMTYFMVTGFVVASVLFFIIGGTFYNLYILVIYAVIQSSFWFISRIANLESLKLIPAVVAMPIFRTSNAFVVIFGIMFLKEILTLTQIIGVILALSIIWILSTENKKGELKSRKYKLGIIIALVGSFSNAIAALLVKMVAPHVNILLFTAVCYGYLILPSLLASKRMSRGKASKSTLLKIAIPMGLFNVAAFYAFMSALIDGPAAIVMPLTGMSILIVILLSILIYKERLTLRRVLAILLSLLAIVLLRK